MERRLSCEGAAQPFVVMERRLSFEGHAYTLGEFVDHFVLEDAQAFWVDSGAAQLAAYPLQLLSDPDATAASLPDAAQPAANSVPTTRAEEKVLDIVSSHGVEDHGSVTTLLSTLTSTLMPC